MTDILKPGDVLGGRYALQSRIARGGMGDVWEASDEVLGRVVAVKVMRPDTQADPVFAARFKDEARHTAGLSHPNIAAVYDYGEQDGMAYLVMELVRGAPLNEIIARGPMAPDQVRSIAGQAALALQAAHDADVVHRDVKPANIMVTPDGRVKLTDFGIARATGGASHTMTGEVIGTPHYLSPEQALGRGATGSSDLYALGIVIYEMLTGTRPFDAGSPVATALQQVNDEPPPLPDTVPADLRAIVASCLAKRPEDRPVSCAALAAELGMTVDSTTGTVVAAAAAGAGAAGAGATEVFAYPQPRHPQAAAYVDQSEYAGEPPEDERARRRGGVWWLIPLVILLGLGAYLAVSMMAAKPATPTPSTTTVTTTLTTTSTTSETSIPTESSTAPTTTTPPTTETSVPSTTSQPPTTTVSSTTPPVTTPATTPVPSVQQTPSPAQTAAGAARSVSP